MPSSSEEHRTFKYDVAFSLLSRDVDLAQTLADELQPLNCFVFTKRQRELAGRNGVEAFAEVFRRDARLAVVLFRSGYGETEYTDLEARGIQDRGMETSWQSPLLINLDSSPPPVWLPSRNIWLDLTRYPVAEAVGAIRLRAEELGARGRIESAAEFALRMSQRRADEEARHIHERSSSALEEVSSEVEQLFADLTSFVNSNTSSLEKCDPFVIPTNTGLAIATRFGSAVIDWRHPYGHSLTDAGIYVKLFDGYVSVGDRRAGRTPTMLSDTELQAEVRRTARVALDAGRWFASTHNSGTAGACSEGAIAGDLQSKTIRAALLTLAEAHERSSVARFARYYMIRLQLS